MHPKELELKIELLRSEMILVGMSKGLTAPETVRISQQLDVLLNIPQKVPFVGKLKRL